MIIVLELKINKIAPIIEKNEILHHFKMVVPPLLCL